MGKTDAFDVAGHGGDAGIRAAGGGRPDGRFGHRRRDGGDFVRAFFAAGGRGLCAGGGGPVMRRHHREHHREDNVPARAGIRRAAAPLRRGKGGDVPARQRGGAGALPRHVPGDRLRVRGKGRVCLFPGRPGKAGKGACGAGEAGVPCGLYGQGAAASADGGSWKPLQSGIIPAPTYGTAGPRRTA